MTPLFAGFLESKYRQSVLEIGCLEGPANW